MERYCIGDICQIEDFQKVDLEETFCIDHKSIVNKTIKKSQQNGENILSKAEQMFAMHRGLLGQYSPFYDESSFSTIEDPDDRKYAIQKNKELRRAENFELINTLDDIEQIPFYEYDISKDVYLTLVAMKRHKDRLFFKKERKKRGESYPGEDIDEKMAQTIKNLKKSHVTYENTIFDMEEISSTDKKTEVSALGLNVKRIWLYDADFRLIFSDVDPKSPKYSIVNIIERLINGSENGLIYNADDHMIFEKLLGIDLCIYISHNILSKMEDPDPCILEPLVNVLMEYNGTSIQCSLLRYLSRDLNMKKTHGSGFNEKDRIKTYIEILQEKLIPFKNKYQKTINTYIQIAKNKYTYETTREGFENRFSKMLIEMNYHPNEKERIKDLLKKAEDTTERVNILYRDIFARKIQQYTCLDSAETLKVIQRKIILNNQKKYNHK